MDMSEMEPVDVDLEIGAACAKDVEAEAIPVFLFHEGPLEGAHGEKRGFRVDADGPSGSDGLRALDGTRLGRIRRRSRLWGLCQCHRGEAEGESGLDHETIHRISFLNDKSDVREVELRCGRRMDTFVSVTLPRLKDRKVIGMVDEDLPEEPHGQQSIEVRCTGILLGAYQGGEGYLLNFN